MAAPAFPLISNELQFVSVNPSMPILENSRALIRKHVMRGKNRKPRQVKPTSWIDHSVGNGAIYTGSAKTPMIPRKLGDEGSLAGLPFDMSRDILETIWKRKSNHRDIFK